MELIKVETKDEVAKGLTKLGLGLVLTTMILTALVFLSLAMAELLNEYMHSNFSGYFVLGSFYIFNAVVLFLAVRYFNFNKIIRKWLWNIISYDHE
jgi:hypothetical protein